MSTFACAIAATWPEDRRIVLAECDPSGGDLAARFGLTAKQGMTSLVLESRRLEPPRSYELGRHLQRLPGGLDVLVGAVGATAARTVDDELPDLVRWAKHSGPKAEDVADLIFDCGRVQPGARGQMAAMGASDHILLVLAPTVESIASTAWVAERLGRFETGSPSSRTGPTARLVLSGDGPVKPSEAAKALGLQVAAVVGRDRIGAAALRGEPVQRWRLSSCPLIRIAKEVTKSLVSAPAVDIRPPATSWNEDDELAGAEAGL